MTKEYKWPLLTILAFTLGIFMGGVYCAFINNDAQIYDYLHSFILQIKDGADKYAVFKKSVVSDIKPLVLVLCCAFMRFGFIPVLAVCAVRGFYTGFTYAALFKYFGNNGMLMILSQIPAEILFFAAITLFGAICARLSFRRSVKKECILLGVALASAAVVLIISAVCEGYLDTWILQSIAVRLY